MAMVWKLPRSKRNAANETPTELKPNPVLLSLSSRDQLCTIEQHPETSNLTNMLAAHCRPLSMLCSAIESIRWCCDFNWLSVSLTRRSKNLSHPKTCNCVCTHQTAQHCTSCHMSQSHGVATALNRIHVAVQWSTTPPNWHVGPNATTGTIITCLNCTCRKQSHADRTC